MLAAFLLAPKLAFFLLTALIVGAAVPLAIAWTRLLPEELPPFEIDDPWRRWPVPPIIPRSDRAVGRSDIVAIVLLVLLTVAFAVQFPGVPREPALNSLPDHLPQASEWFEIALPSLLLLGCLAAIAYGAFQRSFLRLELIVVGGMVLILWAMGPWLYRELTAI
jgi:hypothetical protein